MRALLLLALCICAGCAHSDKWTRADTVVQGILLATVIADGIQTARIQDHPNIVEDGAVASTFLGHNPSTTDVVLYTASLSITQYLISRALPKGWRRIWQVGNILHHGQAVNHGRQIGLWGEPCTRNQDEQPC